MKRKVARTEAHGGGQIDNFLSFAFMDIIRFKDQSKIKLTRKWLPSGIDSYRCPRINETHLQAIVKKVLSGASTPKQAAEEFSSATEVQRQIHPDQRSAFIAHAERYMSTFVEDCGFEFIETKRYVRRKGARKGASHPQSNAVPTPKLDIAVRATRDFKPSAVIEMLKGRTVNLTDAEDDALRQGIDGADFSCIANLGKNCFQLLLGPARFVNHDCSPNVEFERRGKHICFKVLKPIKSGDEIVTSYGGNYFGDGNVECLCFTCEKNKRGAYAPAKVPTGVLRKTRATAHSDAEGSEDGRRRRLRERSESVVYNADLQDDAHEPYSSSTSDNNSTIKKRKLSTDNGISPNPKRLKFTSSLKTSVSFKSSTSSTSAASPLKSSLSSSSISSAEPVVKRGPGRPPKHPQFPMKRGPGRPPKASKVIQKNKALLNSMGSDLKEENKEVSEFLTARDLSNESYVSSAAQLSSQGIYTSNLEMTDAAPDANNKAVTNGDSTRKVTSETPITEQQKVQPSPVKRRVGRPPKTPKPDPQTLPTQNDSSANNSNTSYSSALTSVEISPEASFALNTSKVQTPPPIHRKVGRPRKYPEGSPKSRGRASLPNSLLEKNSAKRNSKRRSLGGLSQEMDDIKKQEKESLRVLDRFSLLDAQNVDFDRIRMDLLSAIKPRPQENGEEQEDAKRQKSFMHILEVPLSEERSTLEGMTKDPPRGVKMTTDEETRNENRPYDDESRPSEMVTYLDPEVNPEYEDMLVQQNLTAVGRNLEDDW